MKAFTVWFAATLGIGWYFDLLGKHPDPAKLTLVLGAWCALWAGVLVYRGMGGSPSGTAHRPDGRGASNIANSR